MSTAERPVHRPTTIFIVIYTATVRLQFKSLSLYSYSFLHQYPVALMSTSKVAFSSYQIHGIAPGARTAPCTERARLESLNAPCQETGRTVSSIINSQNTARDDYRSHAHLPETQNPARDEDYQFRADIMTPTAILLEGRPRTSTFTAKKASSEQVSFKLLHSTHSLPVSRPECQPPRAIT
jgi:hypothetical protein